MAPKSLLVFASFALLIAINISGTYSNCAANWSDPSKVFTLRTNRFEIAVSGASCRVFGVRPSGNVYRDEFVEFVVAADAMLDRSNPFTANVLRAERNTTTSGVCTHRIEQTIVQDSVNTSRYVNVQRIYTNITIFGDTVVFDLAVFNDSYTVKLGSNISFTIDDNNAKISFTLGQWSYPSTSSWLLTKIHLKLFTNFIPLFNSTDSLLIPGRTNTLVTTNEIILKNLKIIYTIDRFAFADEQIYVVPAFDPTHIGVNGTFFGVDPDLNRNYFGAQFWNTWKYYRNITFWDPSLSIVFSTPESLPPSLVSSEPSIVRTLDAQRQEDFLVVAITVPIVLVVLIGVIVVVLVASPATRKRLFPFLAKRNQARIASLHEELDDVQESKPETPQVTPDAAPTAAAASAWTLAKPTTNGAA